MHAAAGVCIGHSKVCMVSDSHCEGTCPSDIEIDEKMNKWSKLYQTRLPDVRTCKERILATNKIKKGVRSTARDHINISIKVSHKFTRR